MTIKLTPEENESIKEISDQLERYDGDFYYDNPSAAIDDLQYLLSLIKKLNS